MRVSLSKRSFLCALLVIFFIFYLISCHVVSRQRNATDLSHNEILKNLGINTALSDYRADSEGNLLKGNPLGRDIGVLHPIKEIFLAGINLDDKKNNHLFDDSIEKWRELHKIEPDTFIANEHKNCIGADVDGDGFEEIVIVYYAPGPQNLQYKLIDREGKIFKAVEDTIPFTVEKKANVRLSIAKGDLDKDNKEEIVIGFDRLYYIKFDESLRLIDSKQYNLQNSALPYDVAMGELNNDGYDEIVVTYDHYFSIFGQPTDKDPDFFKELNRGAIDNNVATFGWSRYSNKVSVAIGDIDSDGYNDIVFHGRIHESGFNGYRVMAANTDAECTLNWLDFYFTTIYSPNKWDYFSRTLAILDYDGDGKFEIFAGKHLFKYESDGTDGKNSKILRKDFTFSIPAPFSTHSLYTQEVPRVLAVGDVDGDKRDDLVYVDFLGNAYVHGLINCDESQCENVTKKTWYGKSKEKGEYAVCLANIDDDSPVIKYTGRKELLFSEPLVLAVLAAPPHYRGIDQIRSGYTTYGEGDGETVTKGSSTGFSFGRSVGIEIEDDVFTQSKFSLEVKK